MIIYLWICVAINAILIHYMHKQISIHSKTIIELTDAAKYLSEHSVVVADKKKILGLLQRRLLKMKLRQNLNILIFMEYQEED